MKHFKSAKAELTTALKAGQTSAKTATFNKKPLSKVAQAKAAQAKADNIKWERPSLVAIHRAMTGNDWAAGTYCITLCSSGATAERSWNVVVRSGWLIAGMLGPLLRV